MSTSGSSGNRGGVAGEHPRRRLSLFVAPTSSGDHHNTLAPPLAPVGCWRLEAARFDFDSSVVRPEAKAELTLLAALVTRIGEPVPALFGHADPVGDDEYNKALSGRRAAAVYGLVTRDVELWDRLYAQPFSTDDWRSGALPLMREVTGQPASTPRKEVFAAYMDAICQDASGQPFSIPKQQFLGKGADPDGKADYQGCSEFNPILVFSKQEGQALERDRQERNRENAPNRRVLMLLFPPGFHVEPAAWPCPRTKESSSGCRPHFWPDGDQRRAQQDRRREYEVDHDTFACALYDGMARRSPCERLRRNLHLRLFGPNKDEIPNAPYRLSLVDVGDVREGTADASGVLTEEGLLVPSRVVVDYGDPRLGQDPVVLAYCVSLMLEADDGTSEEDTARRRLNNLGYPPTEFLSDALRAFQHDYGLEKNGTLDDATRDALEAAAERGKSKSDIARGDLG